MSKHRTWIEIDQKALAHNIAELRKLLAPGAEFAAVLKGNAYGHGLSLMGQLCAREGVRVYAVDSIDEALELRLRHEEAMILVMGAIMPSRLREAVEACLDITVYDKDILRELDGIGSSLQRPASIHLKIDTGMSRQGILPDEIGDYLNLLDLCPNLLLSGVSTHLAVSGHASDVEYAMTQCQRFEEILGRIYDAGHKPRWIHCAKSSATILYPDTHGTLVRPGIALYGIWPSAEVENIARNTGIRCSLLPVLTWKTRIVQVKSLPAGTPVGYDLTEILPKNSRIAVLPIGYYDGYDRGLSSRGYVLVGGYRCKVLGRVCMNMTMIDVSAVPNVAPQMEVTLIGRDGRHRVRASDIANWIQTNPYEVITRIRSDIPRIPVMNYEA